MKNLSDKELELMKHLWKIKKGYLKDIVEEFEAPRPAYTTISTLVNRLIQKKHIGFQMHGRDKEYYPILKKPTYFNFEFKKILRNYFDNSSKQFASFFTKNNDLSLKELEDLREMLDQQIQQKSQKK
jgi:predicted transcriptional regulator